MSTCNHHRLTKNCPYCGVAEGRFHSKECAGLQEPPLPDSYPDAPTLSPEEQAVLDQAMGWFLARENGEHGKAGVHDGSSECAWAHVLHGAIRAYRATLSPRDYAPDELEPGQRFRWAPGCGRDDQADGINIVRLVGNFALYFTCETNGDPNVYSFASSDRLIPLPEQDG